MFLSVKLAEGGHPAWHPVSRAIGLANRDRPRRLHLPKWRRAEVLPPNRLRGPFVFETTPGSYRVHSPWRRTEILPPNRSRGPTPFQGAPILDRFILQSGGRQRSRSPTVRYRPAGFKPAAASSAALPSMAPLGGFAPPPEPLGRACAFFYATGARMARARGVQPRPSSLERSDACITTRAEIGASTWILTRTIPRSKRGRLYVADGGENGAPGRCCPDCIRATRAAFCW